MIFTSRTWTSFTSIALAMISATVPAGIEAAERTPAGDVFKRYQSKLDPEANLLFSACGFYGHFLEMDGNWFLQITPTYRFTKDGYRDSRFSAEALSGIKRLENNQAVHGQVVMWAEFLQKETLFSQHNLVKFYPLLQFTATVDLMTRIG